ncbi:pseudouridine synthase [Phakopsora pachyrhizi]|uniref:tRNA pseudouridine synthase 1 n=1 Tax=Phakopsora pachyrhizi TaxID=170000 RepID=A0AAV0AX45_PHAPC|nr:pseudouridine synthase [Phakopsora pachyrhizi]CAH7674860.1 pseudouridine synthase [Phakopsora pachyrhizi]
MDTGTLSEPPKDSKNPVPYSESHAIKNFEKDIDIFKARGPEEEKVHSPIEERPGAGNNKIYDEEQSLNNQSVREDLKLGNGKEKFRKNTDELSIKQRESNANKSQKRKMNWKCNQSSSKNSRTIDRDEQSESTETVEKRLPKRKVAVLLGYYGKGYQGSQVNPGMRTIEGEVFKALTNAGCISEENSAHPSKVGLQRAARTDANVHAGCNLISLKLILNPTSLNSVTNKSTLDVESKDSNQLERDKLQLLVSHVNSYLPEEIRIWDFIRVQNSFHSRSFCDSRTYEYSLPTYLFLPPKPGSSMYERLNLISIPGSDKKWSEWYEKGEKEASWWIEHPEPIQDENDEKLNSRFKISLMNRKSNYRISSPMLNRIKDCLTQFKGTHNFHNFTVGKEFNERNSIRIIRDVTALDPFIVGQGDGDPGTEWISIKFYGQSFMLHQIRKMIGLLILMCRTRTPPSILPELYGPVKVGIPKAPGLGLILQSPHFNGYNKKVLEVNQQTLKQRTLKISDEELNNLIREPIEPIKHEEKIEKFKRDTLYARMWEEENQENGFGVWINYLDVYQDNDLDFLNPTGTLPKSITTMKSNLKASSKQDSKNITTKTNIKDLFTDEDDKTVYLNGDEIEEG